MSWLRLFHFLGLTNLSETEVQSYEARRRAALGGEEKRTEEVETGGATTHDEGLATLVMLLRFHGVSAAHEQIRHHFGGLRIGIPEMPRYAKELGLKARSYKTSWTQLASTPLPGIAVLRNGGFLFLGKVSDDKALVQAPLAARPILMTRAELEAVWGGQLILMTRRAGLMEVSRRFDIAWFVGAIHKYRHPLAGVVLASFILQLFALVSPLFLRVVIDQVLVHRSLSTLEVLAVGLVTISVFETIFSIS